MERESMLVYKSFIDVSKGLNDAEYRLFWDAIHNYGVYGKEIPKFDNPMLNALMVLIEPLMRANIKNYENGVKGGAPKGNQNARAKNNPKTTQKQPGVESGLNKKTTQKQGNVTVTDTVTENATVTATDTVNVTDTVTDNVNVNVNVKEKERNPYIDINTMSITDFDKYDEWNREHGVEG